MSFTTNIFLFFYFPFSILGYAFLRLCCARLSDIANKAGSVFLIICSLFFYGWKRPETVIGFLLYMLLIYMLGQYDHCAVQLGTVSFSKYRRVWDFYKNYVWKNCLRRRHLQRGLLLQKQSNRIHGYRLCGSGYSGIFEA